MPLFLNGEPFKLKNDELAKYQRKDSIYRVGQQFITQVPQQDLSESPISFFIGMVHIPCSYYMYSIDSKNGTRTPMGELRWADSRNPRPEMGHNVMEYKPPYIGIDNAGYITVSSYEAEKNFFLDNHPANEVVKNNNAHPNHDPKIESLFATYHEDRMADKRQLELDIAYEVETALRERTKDNTYVMNLNALKGIAAILVNGSSDRNINVSELMRYDTMDEKVLRQRMISVTKRHPVFVKEALESNSVDFRVAIENFKEEGVISLNGDQWLFHLDKIKKENFLRVPDGVDAQEYLYVFFKDKDQDNKMFMRMNENYKRKKKAAGIARCRNYGKHAR